MLFDYFDAVAAAALSNAFVATLIAVPAFLASRWAKPTVAHALWLLVLVKLVTPPLVEMPVTLPAAMVTRSASPVVESKENSSEVTTSGETEGTQLPLQLPRAEEREPLRPVVPPIISEQLSTTDRVDRDEPPRGDPLEAATLETPEFSDLTQVSPPFEFEQPTVESLLTESTVAHIVDPGDALSSLALDEASNNETVEQFAAAPSTNASQAESEPASEPSASAAAIAGGDSLPQSTSFSLAAFLCAVWLTGTVAWCLLASQRILRFRRAIKNSAIATPPLQAEVAALAAQIELHRVPEVLIVPGQVSPLVCTPLGRAVLILPRDLLTRFTDEQRSAVIAHELAHLRRRDHWTRWLELVVIAVYWWLPTVWIARRLLHQAEEACCDAWVVWLLPQRSRDYARALLETIDFLTPAPDAPLLSSGFGRASTLKRRFDMILRQHASHRLSWPARIGIAAASLVILPCSLTALSADDTTPAATPAAPRAENPPSGQPSSGPTPPSAGNVPTTDAPSTSAPSALPAPAASPSAENAPQALPPATPSAPTADPRLPTPAVVPIAPRAELPLTPPATAPVPAAGLTPPSTTPPSAAVPTATPALATPRATPPAVVTAPSPSSRGRVSADSDDDNVQARLERLEATTAELLMLVKQLRDERHGPTKSYGIARDSTVPMKFSVRYGHDDQQLDIMVAGKQVTATNADNGKIMWAASMPWNVTAVQGGKNQLVVSGDGGEVVMDPDNGEFKASSVNANPINVPAAKKSPSKVSVPADPTASSHADKEAAALAARRADEIAKIEMEMIAVERELAQQQAELQHQVRQMETRRARLARKLDALTADANSDDRLKLTAQLEEAEDQLAGAQHKADVFQADLDFKVREIELRRDQLLRANSVDPSAAPSTSKESRRTSKAER